MSATISFDLDRLRRGMEERDADALLSLYAEDAEITEVDANNPPRSPRVLRGKAQIAEHLRDVCARDMTHRLERPVIGPDRLAYTEACRYADGTNVLCMATAELDGQGRIVSQVAVTAWDG